MMKRKIKFLPVFCILVALSVFILFGIIYIGNQIPSQREDITVYTAQGEEAQGYNSYDEFSASNTLQADGGLPDYINGSDAAIIDVTEEKQNAHTLCGNKNSKIYHKASCSSLKNTKEENKIYFSSKQEFLNNGYRACSRCNP